MESLQHPYSSSHLTESSLPSEGEVLQRIRQLQLQRYNCQMAADQITIKPEITPIDEQRYYELNSSIAGYTNEIHLLFQNRVKGIPLESLKKKVEIEDELFAEVCKTARYYFQTKQKAFHFSIQQHEFIFHGHYDNSLDAITIKGEMGIQITISFQGDKALINEGSSHFTKLGIYFLFIALTASEIQPKLPVINDEDDPPMILELFGKFYCSWFSPEKQTIYIQSGDHFEQFTGQNLFGVKIQSRDGITALDFPTLKGNLFDKSSRALYKGMLLLNALYQQVCFN